MSTSSAHYVPHVQFRGDLEQLYQQIMSLSKSSKTKQLTLLDCNNSKARGKTYLHDNEVNEH